MNSPLVDFYTGSHDFLQLLAKKTRQASVNTEAAKELETLQTFFDIAQALITRSQTDLHEAKLLSINEHVKGIILEGELKRVYNVLFKSGNTQSVIDFLKTTVIPTKQELSKDVNIK